MFPTPEMGGGLDLSSPQNQVTLVTLQISESSLTWDPMPCLGIQSPQLDRYHKNRGPQSPS